jgi:hypothetical protein
VDETETIEEVHEKKLRITYRLSYEETMKKRRKEDMAPKCSKILRG